LGRGIRYALLCEAAFERTPRRDGHPRPGAAPPARAPRGRAEERTISGAVDISGVCTARSRSWLRSWVADERRGRDQETGHRIHTTHEKTAGKTQVAFSHSRIALRRTSLIHEIHSTAENPPPIPKTPPDHSSVSCGCAPPRDLSRAVPWESRLAHVVLAPDGGIQSLRGCSVGAGSAYADE
jgi:hypothetical protein